MGITRACLLPYRGPLSSVSASSTRTFVSKPRPLAFSLSSSSLPFSSTTTSPSSSRAVSISSVLLSSSNKEARSSKPAKGAQKQTASSWSIKTKPNPKVAASSPGPASWMDKYIKPTLSLQPSPAASNPRPPPPPPLSQGLASPFSALSVPGFLSSSPDTLSSPSTRSTYSPPDEVQPYVYSPDSEPYHYIPPSLFKKDPAYEALDHYLLVPTVHPDRFASQDALDRSDNIWEAYQKVKNHISLPASTWTALLANVVPPTRVAAYMTGKRNEFGSTMEYGSAVLTNYLRRGYEERFHRIMQDKAKAGLEPLRNEFALIMRHFAPNGYVKGVESIFAAMVLKGLEPTPQDYELRLEAIVFWLRRYNSLEAESLIADGVLHPFDIALSSVPDLVGGIMESLNSAGFTPTLTRRTVDLACEIFAFTKDARAYNLLARYEYGVDLDVPDAIPEEFLARMQQGEDVRRGLTRAGLETALELWGKDGDFYKTLSMFEVFAYPLAMPEGTPRGLAPSPTYPRDFAPFTIRGKSFAPPLPPTTAFKMMNLVKVPVASPSPSSPETNIVDSDSSSAPSTSPHSIDSPSSSTNPTAFSLQPRPSDLSFPLSSDRNVNAHVFTTLLKGPCTSSGPLDKGDIFLSKHILTHALSHYYSARQSFIGQHLHILSLSSAEERALARLRMRRFQPSLARVDWFKLFSKCCVQNPGREAFEALRWAEKEMNLLRGAWEMDGAVMRRVQEIFEEDDRVEEMERRMAREGSDPTRSPPPNTVSSHSTFKGPSLDAQLATLNGQIKQYNQIGVRLLGFRLAVLAWKDTRLTTSLLAQGRPHAFQFPDGSTIGSRLHEYSVILAERLPHELEPRSARTLPTSSGNALTTTSVGAGGARGAEDFAALFLEEERMSERMQAALEAGSSAKMSWNWGLHKGRNVDDVLEGEDHDPVNPSPFRRHQMKKASRFGRYPTVPGADDPSLAWLERSGRGGESERMGNVVVGGGDGGEWETAEELPEEVKKVQREWERGVGEVERRYRGEEEEVGKGVWA